MCVLSESSAYSQRSCLCVFSVYENRHITPLSFAVASFVEAAWKLRMG